MKKFRRQRMNKMREKEESLKVYEQFFSTKLWSEKKGFMNLNDDIEIFL